MLFSITAAGVLSFKSAPNYESPVDSGGNNVYNLVVTATSGTGSRVRTATQTITVTVINVNEPNSPATGKPVIRGVVAVGESLLADVSGVRDLDGVPSSFVYQWVRVDNGSEEDISGATRAIYNVVSADEGKLLKIKVGFIDGEGYSEDSLASDFTGAVLDAAPSVSHGTNLPGTLSITSIPNQLSAFGSIWSDGITLYGLSSATHDYRIYAYTLSDGSRDRSKEFSNVGNGHTEAIWSDGVTMWVAYTTQSTLTTKVFAYRMSDKSRDSGKDFDTLGSGR